MRWSSRLRAAQAQAQAHTRDAKMKLESFTNIIFDLHHFTHRNDSLAYCPKGMSDLTLQTLVGFPLTTTTRYSPFHKDGSLGKGVRGVEFQKHKNKYPWFEWASATEEKEYEEGKYVERVNGSVLLTHKIQGFEDIDDKEAQQWICVFEHEDSEHFGALEDVCLPLQSIDAFLDECKVLGITVDGTRSPTREDVHIATFTRTWSVSAIPDRRCRGLR